MKPRSAYRLTPAEQAENLKAMQAAIDACETLRAWLPVIPAQAISNRRAVEGFLNGLPVLIGLYQAARDKTKAETRNHPA